jgi:DNA-binding transcriptional MerR regulator
MGLLSSEKSKRIYSRKDVFDELQDVADVTEREISYWTDLEIVTPDIANPRSQGKTRFYSLWNVVDFAVVKKLLESGLRLEFIKKVMDFLRSDKGDREFFYEFPFPHRMIITDPNTDEMKIWIEKKAIPKEAREAVAGYESGSKSIEDLALSILQIPLTISEPFETLFALDVRSTVRKIIGIKK